MHKVLFLLALLILATLPPLPASAQSRRVSLPTLSRRSFPAKATLRVENLRGNITVHLGRASSIEVTASRSTGEVRSEELIVAQTAGALSLITRPDTDAIDLKVTTPEGTDLRLFSDSGNIRVTGAPAGVFARSRTGSVTIELPTDLDVDVALTGSSVNTPPSLRSISLKTSTSVYGQIGQGGSIVTAHSDRGEVTLTNISEGQMMASTRTSDDLADTSPTRSRRAEESDEPILRNHNSDSDKVTPIRPVLRHNRDTASSTEAPKASTESDDSDAENVLKIESQLVTLNASAVDDAGRPVVDLSQSDFSVFEDGVKQEIVHFQSVNVPFNLVLLIDLSGSVKEKIRLIQRSAWRFVQATRPEDKVAIVTFTSSTRLVSPLTNDRELLRRRIESIRNPEGGTNFYDAVYDTLRWLVNKSRGERNAIVVMSDGVDNALPGVPGSGSEVSFIELYNLVQESDTIIFPVYLNTEQEAVEDWGFRLNEAYSIARKQLRDLAETTGGNIYYANKVSDLDGCYEQVASELRTIYSLGYYPSNSEKDGSYRKIRVKVARSDVQVKARRGYYAKRS